MGGAEEQQPPAGAEELAAQKREQRLRKFRELHLKRVSCTGGHLTHVTWPGINRLYLDLFLLFPVFLTLASQFMSLSQDL